MRTAPNNNDAVPCKNDSYLKQQKKVEFQQESPPPSLLINPQKTWENSSFGD